MRNLVVRGLCGVLGLFFGASILAQNEGAKSEKLIEWHYIGKQGLNKLDDLKGVQEILKLPETTALWNTAVQRWAKQSAERYANGGNADPATTRAIAELIEDVGMYESRFELSGGENSDWILAVRIPRERHDLWSTNLWQMATRSKLGTPTASAQGWAVQGKEQRYNLSVSREKNWTVLTGGSASAEAQKTLVSSLKDTDAKDFVLKAKADLPRLTQIWKHAALQHAPKISVTVTPRDQTLRTETQLIYPQELGIKAEKWNVPVSTIRDPLIGFTAIQGLQKHLEKSPILKDLKAQKIPNQLFIWSQAVSPFSIYMAADVGDPKAFIHSVKSSLSNPALTNKLASSQFILNPTNSYLAWKGLPIVVPHLRPGTGQESGFVVGGMFPVENPSTNPPPAELLEQLNQKDVVFYEWEITQERLPQWRIFSQLTRIAQNKPILPQHAPSEQWIAAIAPHLGNTITSITLEKPNELKMVRRSHSGLNALELVALAHSLDNPAPDQANPPAQTPPPLNNQATPQKPSSPR